MANGYVLVGVGDSCSDDDASEVSIDGWNTQTGSYCFKYVPEDRKGPGLLYKALKVDTSLLASFLHLSEGSSPVTLELDVSKYTADAADLSSAFTNLDELAAKVESVVAAKESASGTGRTPQQAASTSNTTTQPPPDQDDPLRDPNFRPTRPTYGQDPLLVGGGDLNPLGLGRPGRSNPFPGEGFPDPMMGGGMHVGPEHPYFRDHVRNPQIRPGIPPPGVPPGARWDPIRPPGMPGFNPEDFQRQPNRGVHPDIGPPPGQGTNWDSMFG